MLYRVRRQENWPKRLAKEIQSASQVQFPEKADFCFVNSHLETLVEKDEAGIESAIPFCPVSDLMTCSTSNAMSIHHL